MNASSAHKPAAGMPSSSRPAVQHRDDPAEHGGHAEVAAGALREIGERTEDWFVPGLHPVHPGAEHRAVQAHEDHQHQHEQQRNGGAASGFGICRRLSSGS